MKIIDTHVHIYDPSRPNGVPWPPADNALLYRTVLPMHCRDVAMPLGVTGALVVEASEWLEDNQWVLDIAANEPFIVGLIGRVEPSEFDFGAHIERFSANRLFRGIRFWGPYLENPTDGRFLDSMRLMADKGLVVDLPLRPEQMRGCVDLADRLPDLQIMIEHIGHVSVTGKAPDPFWLEGINSAAQRSQIYMKVSALMENSSVQPAPDDPSFCVPTLDALWNAFGPNRLVYGSNWPVCEISGSYAQAMRIVRSYFSEKGEEVIRKFFAENAYRFYRLDKRL